MKAFVMRGTGWRRVWGGAGPAGGCWRRGGWHQESTQGKEVPCSRERGIISDVAQRWSGADPMPTDGGEPGHSKGLGVLPNERALTSWSHVLGVSLPTPRFGGARSGSAGSVSDLC